MKYLKRFNESGDNLYYNIKDILLELSDAGLQVNTSILRNDINDKLTHKYLEVVIQRPWGSPDRTIEGAPTPPSGKYPGDIFLWKEVKDTIIHLVEWYYSQSSFSPNQKPIRFFSSGVEFANKYCNEKDFEGIGDLISFNRLKLEIRLD